MNHVERARLADVAGKLQRTREFLADDHAKDFDAAFTALDASQRTVYELLNWQWPPERSSGDRGAAAGRPVRTPTDEGHRRTDRSLPDNNDGV